jgi:glycosyltransferase involved in cell wall biosynthesis
LAEEVFQSDLKRDRSISRRRRWGQACVLARELPDDVNHLHTHFLHTPASVTRYAAIMRGIGWSFSAHAKDIWTSPRWELTEKIADADWGATCTNVNAQYLRQLANGKTPIDLVYHGLALDRFPSPKSEYSHSTGDHSDPVQLLSVGRLVEKKGYDDLLHALGISPISVVVGFRAVLKHWLNIWA